MRLNLRSQCVKPFWPASAGYIPRKRFQRSELRQASYTGLLTSMYSVNQILLVLKPMDGVAVTFGSETMKEVHFSLDHIKRSKNRARDEIMGVLVHEIVHCYQYDAKGTCPGGLIEGIAGNDYSCYTRNLR